MEGQNFFIGGQPSRRKGKLCAAGLPRGKKAAGVYSAS
jgi:hypothetical protein